MRTKILAMVALVLAACEGEPPKTPVGSALPSAAEAAGALSAPADNESQAPSSSAAAAPGAPCGCTCNCPGAGNAVAATSASASASPDGGTPPISAVASATAPLPPAPTALPSIAGNVTSMPKSAAATAVVYLEGAPVEPTAKMSVTITNHMMTFSPYLAVVPVGGKVVFSNDDPFPHNVFSPDGERFNMGMIPQHEARIRGFKNAGAYALLCNLHPGMLGYLVVTPSSYFAKTDAHGHFQIKNVPPGTYKATAWAPRVQPVTQPVTVAGGDVSIDFELHR